MAFRDCGNQVKELHPGNIVNMFLLMYIFTLCPLIIYCEILTLQLQLQVVFCNWFASIARYKPLLVLLILQRLVCLFLVFQHPKQAYQISHRTDDESEACSQTLQQDNDRRMCNSFTWTMSKKYIYWVRSGNFCIFFFFYANQKTDA